MRYFMMVIGSSLLGALITITSAPAIPNSQQIQQGAAVPKIQQARKGVVISTDTVRSKFNKNVPRKVAKVLVTDDKEDIYYRGDKDNNLQEHSIVATDGGRVKDLPGGRYHIIRGTLDTAGVKSRQHDRRKYSTKKPK